MGFTVGNAFSEGWRVMKAHYGSLLGAVAVYLLISLALNMIPFIGPLAALVLTGPLAAGYLYLGVRAYRGQVEFADLFLGFKKFGETLGLCWLLVLIFLGAAIPAIVGGIVGGIFEMDGIGIIAVVCGSLVTLALWFYLGVRLAFCFHVCMDSDIGITDSLKWSWGATQQHIMPLMGMFLLLGLLQIGLTILLYLPAIFLGMPLSLCVWGATYFLISDASVAPAEFDNADPDWSQEPME